MFRRPAEAARPPTGESTSVKRTRFPVWMLAAVLGLLTFALYTPVLRHGFVAYDDDQYVTANLEVQHGLTPENIRWAFTSEVDANWHPLTMLSHMLDCQLYGLRPWGHHLTSLLLHALNTVLVFLLLHRLTGFKWRSAMVAALFGWHPLHVESVAWVAERKDVLSTCFGLLTLLLYSAYAQGRKTKDSGAAEAGASPAFYVSGRYWLAWVCFALGLLSKPMLVTWPFVLLLLDYWPLQRFQPGRAWRLVVEKLPFFALAAAASLMTFHVQQQTGAMKILENLTLASRCENAVISYGRYLLKLIWPVDLAFFYPYPGHWPAGWVVLAGALLAGISIMVWLARRRYPFLPVGWFWFLGTLVPVIGLVQVGIQAMADRYTYIPSLGVFMLVVWGVAELARHWRQERLAGALAALVAVILCAATWHQIGFWQNSEILFHHSLKVTADNEVARNNLGTVLMDRGDVDAAMTEFKAALQDRATCVEALNNLGNAFKQKGQTQAAVDEYETAIRLQPGFADPHNNLGTILLAQGQTNAAFQEFQTAVRLRPDYVEARNSVAVLLVLAGRTNEAITQFQQILKLRPNYPDVRYNFGSLLARSGQTDLAIGQFQEALREKPDDPQVHFELGNALASQGQADEAIAQLQAAVLLKADWPEAHNNLGNALAKQGETEAAVREFQEALRLQPDYADAHYNWANLLAKNGQTAEAIAQFQQTLSLRPDDAGTHYKLGNLFARTGRTDEAMSQFQAAIRLAPDFAEAHNNLGNLLSARNRTDDAIAQFQAAVRSRPDYRDAHYNLASAFYKLGRVDDAIGEFQTVTRLTPDFAPAHHYLAVALAKAGRATDAIAEFHAAIRLKPDYAAAHDQLGLVLGGQGRLDDAIVEFREALRLRPDSADASNNLARALEMKAAAAKP
jgi:tetratricopeptide (TPR) repeat protein